MAIKIVTANGSLLEGFVAIVTDLVTTDRGAEN